MILFMFFFPKQKLPPNYTIASLYKEVISFCIIIAHVDENDVIIVILLFVGNANDYLISFAKYRCLFVQFDTKDSTRRKRSGKFEYGPVIYNFN